MTVIRSCIGSELFHEMTLMTVDILVLLMTVDKYVSNTVDDCRDTVGYGTDATDAIVEDRSPDLLYIMIEGSSHPCTRSFDAWHIPIQLTKSKFIQVRVTRASTVQAQ